MTPADYIIAVVRILIILGMILCAIPCLIWMERKGSAYIQDRRGPNRASILGIRLGGLIHNIADAFKLLTKTDISGESVARPLFILAPIIGFSVALITVAVVPFAEPVVVFGRIISLQIADLKGGLLYVLALSSLGVYSLLIAGWSSSGKYSFLGALRASAQMISYELAMGLAVLAVFLVSGSLRLYDIVADQGATIWTWNFIRQPIAFMIFMVAIFAETNRLPFDLPEGESELVAGYHTEYSSMRFAMFFMGEYAHIVVASLIITTAFLGGWQIPFVTKDMMLGNMKLTLAIAGWVIGTISVLIGIFLTRRFKRRYNDARDYETLVVGLPCLAFGVALIIYVSSLFWGSWSIMPVAGEIIIFIIQIIVVLVKSFLCASIFIWVRWTFPRFRYDQLMRLGWKVMLPLGLINVFVTAGVLLFV